MPEPGLVLGIDIGTTGVKVEAVDVAATSHCGAAREYPTESPHPHWSEQDPDVVAAATADAVREVAAGVGAAGRPIAGVAFSSAMHSLIGLAADGTRLTPLVTWADGRAAVQARRLRESVDWLALHRRTGTPVHPMSPLVKLLWFRENRPDVWRRAAHWLGIKEYLLYRLTGLLAVDESLASGTGLYRLETRDWDEEALALAGLRRDQLPALRPTTDVVTHLGPEAADWGLPRGTPVVLGAGDGVLANLGLGAVAPGLTACSIGTSAAIRGVVPEARVDDEGGVFCYVLVPGRWVVGGATNNGGNVLRWLGRVVGGDLSDPDSRLPELAAEAPPGAEGLLMLPYLSGERAPRWSGEPHGAVLGLTWRHTRAHLVRAALEGVSLQLGLVLQAMRGAGLQLAELRATGGFARSAFWRQLLADVLGTPIGFTEGGQGSATGAGLLGHVALGNLRSVDEAAAAVQVTEVVHPDPAAARFYRELLPVFAVTGDAVESLHARLSPGASDEATGPDAGEQRPS
ncbi:gluconokinase [Geodermatophilus ruber]|uniref:Gluconate kinase, FGGY family n=1 Tax=Geodermatophilus ruber TaxID=504800 RepID=A0A1I4BQF9_9ACTN|nr:gluconokinase [Geodermatophilus ruber]SFK70447.1 gluconate kinase, FGGY family [Geodermatophilus ruber]